MEFLRVQERDDEIDEEADGQQQANHVRGSHDCPRKRSHSRNKPQVVTHKASVSSRTVISIP